MSDLLIKGLTGGLAGLALNQQNDKQEAFYDTAGMSTGVFVVVLVVVLLLILATVVSSYRIMGKRGIHAVLTLIFGMFYIWLIWIWAGIFAGKQLK